MSTHTELEPEQRAEAAPPSGVITWHSAAERNRLLKLWRRAVMIAFGEQARCLRVAWVLDQLFNAKTGCAFPSNPAIADESASDARGVQRALQALEEGGAIIRTGNSAPGRKGLRLIYPATALMERYGYRDRRGYGQLVTVHNLRRRTPRIPKTEMERARRVAAMREGRITSGRDITNTASGPKGGTFEGGLSPEPGPRNQNPRGG